MAKPPAFQFYANDFMDATRLWEANACGLLIRCLCIQWTQGSIPADLKILARAVHCDRSELEGCWKELGAKFIDQGDGTLKNRRLEEIRARQTAISEKRSEAGKAGVMAKANASANGQAKNKQRKVKVKEKVEREGEVEAEEVEMKEPEIIPAGMSVELHRAIGRWKKYRHEIHKPLKTSTVDAFTQKCKEWGDDRAVAAIDHSIAQGWTGCFEPKSNGPTTLTPQEADRRASEYFARKRAGQGA